MRFCPGNCLPGIVREDFYWRERFDGCGSPEGLPLIVRFFSIAGCVVKPAKELAPFCNGEPLSSSTLFLKIYITNKVHALSFPFIFCCTSFFRLAGLYRKNTPANLAGVFLFYLIF